MSIKGTKKNFIRGFTFFFLILQGCTPQEKENNSFPSLQEEDISFSSSDPKTPLPEEDPLWKPLQTVVSLTMKHPIPLKELLQELLSQANIEGEIHETLTTPVSLSSQKKPLKEILERLVDTHNLRIIFYSSYIRIEPDEPFLKSYSLQALSLKRTGKHNMGVGTNVFKGEKTGEENGSSSFLSSESFHDFWQELSANLSILLGQDPTKKEEKKSPPFTLNKQSGLVLIKATEKQHKIIESYLKQLQDQHQSQVLIEAKIIEVALNQNYRHGIDWKLLRSHLGIKSSFLSQGPLSSSSQEMVGLSIGGKGLNGILSFLETFGTSRTLSNPRLTVMNNQPAILKVARNYVYFTMNYSRKNLELPLHAHKYNRPLYYDIPTTQVTSEIHTVPIGLVLTVQPSINEKTGEIHLSLRPTITSVVGHVDDPAVEILSDRKAHSRIPLVEVREIDSVLKIKSGETSVVGGIMKLQESRSESGFPFSSNVPLGDLLFSGGEQEKQMTELVILIRATILKSSPPL